MLHFVVLDDIGLIFLNKQAPYVGFDWSKTISKFIHRFRYIEESAADAGKSLNDMTLDEMEKLWEEAKNK